MNSTGLLVLVIVTALVFDFTNGFHDTANAMATSIATGALRPRLAVLVSAIGNFAGAFISLKVATTIAKGIVDSHLITLQVISAALLGAILWNLLTWWLGLPSSSSHALIGGLIGAAWAVKENASSRPSSPRAGRLGGRALLAPPGARAAPRGRGA
jgi:PiT family inorganic phosphate transporter